MWTPKKLAKAENPRQKQVTMATFPPMPLLCSYLCRYDRLKQHTSGASSSPSTILPMYGRIFLLLAYSLQNRSASTKMKNNNRWCDALIRIKHYKPCIHADNHRLPCSIYANVYWWARRLYSHAHPHKMKSPYHPNNTHAAYVMQQST